MRKIERKNNSSIINTDMESYANAKSRKKQKDAVSRLEKRIDLLEQQIEIILKRNCNK